MWYTIALIFVFQPVDLDTKSTQGLGGKVWSDDVHMIGKGA